MYFEKVRDALAQQFEMDPENITMLWSSSCPWRTSLVLLSLMRMRLSFTPSAASWIILRIFTDPQPLKAQSPLRV